MIGGASSCDDVAWDVGLLQCAWNDRLEAVKGVVQPDMFVFVARLHQSICLLVWCMIMRQICAHRHKIEVHVSHWSGAWPERPLSKQRQEPAHDKEKEQEYTLEEWSISQDAATTGTNNMLCIRFRKCTDNILPFARMSTFFSRAPHFAQFIQCTCIGSMYLSDSLCLSKIIPSAHHVSSGCS